jgi:hypothetical protein
MVRPGVGRPASRWRVLRHLTTEQAKDDRALSSDTSFRASAPASHVAQARRIGGATRAPPHTVDRGLHLGRRLRVFMTSSRWAPSPQGATGLGGLDLFPMRTTTDLTSPSPLGAFSGFSWRTRRPYKHCRVCASSVAGGRHPKAYLADLRKDICRKTSQLLDNCDTRVARQRRYRGWNPCRRADGGSAVRTAARSGRGVD